MVGTPTDHSCVTQADGASLAGSSGRPSRTRWRIHPRRCPGIDAGVQQPTCRRSRLLRRCLRMLPLFSFLHRLLRGGSRGMRPSHDPRPSGRQGEANALQRASGVRRAHPSLRTQPLRERRTREAQILPQLDVRDLPHPRSLIDPRSGNSKPGHHLVQGEQIRELVCSAGVLDGQGRYLLLGGPRAALVNAGQCLRGTQLSQRHGHVPNVHALNWRRTRTSQGTWSATSVSGGRVASLPAARAEPSRARSLPRAVPRRACFT